MSVLSIYGIVICNLLFKKFFYNFIKPENKITKYLIDSVTLTLSAPIIITPIIAYYFGVFSIVSPLVNLIIVPLFSVALVFSLTTVIFSYIFFPLAEIFAGSVELIFKLCVNITVFIASLDFSAITGHHSLVLIALLSSIFMVYIFASQSKQQLIFRFTVCILFFPAIIFLNNKDVQTQPEIFIKERYCLLSIPLNENEKFVWIADRKPTYGEVKHFDRGLINYFAMDKRIKYVGISGNFGNEFVQNILLEGENSGRYHIRELSFAEQREIEKQFLDGKYISQLP
jgi:hypothetical protein